MFLLLFFLTLSIRSATKRVVKQCAFEKSGYFIILDKMTYDDAAMSCVQQGAVLAPFLPGLIGIINTCAEWEMDTLEPWIARRMGDIKCPYISVSEENNMHAVQFDQCEDKTTRPAICWRYPIELVTVTKTRTAYSTLTDYVPVVVGTAHVIPSSIPTDTTFIWTNTVTETITKQKRVPKYLLEYDPTGSDVTLTKTIHERVTMREQVPSQIATEEELAIAVHHATLWQTQYTATLFETVSVNCN